jgi:hypothetical protein
VIREEFEVNVRDERLADFWTEGLDAYERFNSIDVAAGSYVPLDAAGAARPSNAETN